MIELKWFEINLIVALRVLLPFFSKHNFRISELNLNNRDGDYIVALRSLPYLKVTVILNPGFDIIIERKVNLFDIVKKNKPVSLKEVKEIYPEFSNLKENFKTEEELHKLLEGYIYFLEKNFLNY